MTELHETVVASCRALFDQGQVTELRVLELKGSSGYRYNAAGWFNDWDRLASEVFRITKKEPSGIYVTINPVNQACIARTENELVERIKETTSDRDILARNWFPIDIDPCRPSGVSSNDEELKAAHARAKAVIDYLESECSWPKGIRAASGNGFHLLYRVNLPNDADAKSLVEQALKALAARFNDTAVKVDTTLFNPSRIMKLWGTAARKGHHTEDRPHRQSRLQTRLPFADFAILDRRQLEDLAGKAPKQEAKTSKAKATAGGRAKKATASKPAAADESSFQFDLDGFMERFGIRPTRSEPFDGTGIRHILECCLFDRGHTGTSAILGRAPSGAIFYKCQHDSCAGKGWQEAKALFDETVTKEFASKSNNEETELSPWELAARFIDETFCHDDTGGITLRRHREQFYVYDRNEIGRASCRERV